MQTLREARIRRMWGIRDLAAAAGVSPKTVVQIEAGRGVPRYTTMRKIAAALGVEPTAIADFAEVVEEMIQGKVAA